MRKQLEKESICDCLKGRIKYFVTLYRESHDGWEGRISVSVDGKELFRSNTFEWRRFLFQKWENGNKDQEKIAIESHNEGIVDLYSFYKAFYFYQNHCINESLTSEDPLIRLFAILDKRVGKRTLYKLEESSYIQPQWLQFFYRLRLEAEGIVKSVSPNEHNT